MKKIFAAVALAAMAVAMFAGPAAAHEGVGTFTGQADVGQSFDNPATALVTETCVNGVPQGRQGLDRGVYGDGLFLPSLAQVNGVWALETLVTGVPAGGLLVACGKLGPGQVTNLGAACGVSEGHSGGGMFGDATLTSIGWRTSAGGTIPTEGTYEAPDGHEGTIISLTQAQGGTACIAAEGAKGFTVVGVSVIVPA